MKKFLLLSVISAVSVAGARAQTLSEAAGPSATLQSLSGNITNICPRLGALGGFGLTGDVGDLYDRCNGAIASAGAGDIAAANAALDQIAPQEIIAQAAGLDGPGQANAAVIGGRLAALTRFGGGLQTAAAGAPLVFAQAETVASDAGPEGLRGRGWQLYGSATYGFGDRDATVLESAYDLDSYALTVGGDIETAPGLTLGAALGYADGDVEFAGGAGDLTSEAVTLGGYAVYTAANEAYVSGYLGYSWSDFESSRRLQYTDANGAVNRTAVGGSDAGQWEVAASAGLPLAAGAISWGPTASLSYRRLEIDGFRETGAQGLDLVYADQDSESLIGTVGVQASRAVSTASGVFSPYARAAFAYEAMDDSRTIAVRYVNDPFPDSPTIRVFTDGPDRDRFLLGGGVAAQFANGISAFVDGDAVVGQDDVSAYAVTLGLRKTL